MTLRDEAITHVARTIAESTYRGRRGLNEAWENYTHATRRSYEIKAEAALDALLDFLTEHVKEWDEESFSLYAWKPKDDPPKLGALYHIAALRGTTE